MSFDFAIETKRQRPLFWLAALYLRDQSNLLVKINKNNNFNIPSFIVKINKKSNSSSCNYDDETKSFMLKQAKSLKNSRKITKLTKHHKTFLDKQIQSTASFFNFLNTRTYRKT